MNTIQKKYYYVDEDDYQTPFMSVDNFENDEWWKIAHFDDVPVKRLTLKYDPIEFTHLPDDFNVPEARGTAFESFAINAQAIYNGINYWDSYIVELINEFHTYDEICSIFTLAGECYELGASILYDILSDYAFYYGNICYTRKDIPCISLEAAYRRLLDGKCVFKEELIKEQMEKIQEIGTLLL